jgi:hypothetical protein
MGFSNYIRGEVGRESAKRLTSVAKIRALGSFALRRKFSGGA